MNSKFFLNLLIFFSCFFMGFPENPDESSKSYADMLTQGVGDFMEATQNSSPNDRPPMECMEKLLPCKPFLQSPSSAPPTCCVPLKDMVTNEVQCLCTLITNANLLKSFNVTEDDAINLAKACGANPEISLCKNSTSTSPPAAPSLLPNVTHSSANSSGGSPSNSTTPKSAGPRRMSNFDTAAHIALLLTFISLAFLA